MNNSKKEGYIRRGEIVSSVPQALLRFEKGSRIRRGSENRIFFKFCEVHTDDVGNVIEWDKVLECTIPYYGDVPPVK